MLLRRAALVLAAADVLTASLVLFGVFVALPARWWPVDTAAAALAAVELIGGMGLLARPSWGRRVARIASAIALAIGLLTASALALTAGWLSGIYGPVGKGGAIILGFVAMLMLPYLVVVPIVQLLWLGSDASPRRAPTE